MASTILFVDSFDHYTTNAQFLKKWTSGSNNPAPTTVGRNGTKGMRLNGFGSILEKGIPNTAEGGISWAYKPSGFNGNLLYVQNAIEPHLRFYTDSGGHIRVDRWNSTNLGASSKSLSIGVYYDIEIHWLIHASAGKVDVWVDGDLWLSITGANTKGLNAAVVDFVRFFGVGATDDLDDVVIWSGDTPLGPNRVECLLPSGNGATSNLVGSDADSTDNYLHVDEATPDDDSTYVESSTPGDKDTYACSNLSSATGAVLAVQISAYARKTDAGARSIVTIARSGGGTEEDSSPVGLPSTYGYLSDVRPTKPGGGAWAVADVNAAEFGVKVDA